MHINQFYFVLAKRKSWKVRMDPGWDPTAGLFPGLIVAGAVYIIGVLSDLVPIYIHIDKECLNFLKTL